MQTLSELRSHINNVSHESGINSTIDAFINLTLQEINDPAWATNGYNHKWSFLRRKYTLTTVASTEYYQLPRDLDKISIVRQTTSDMRLKYYSDDLFYRLIPDPTATGNPTVYRLWEEEGISTRLTAAGTIDVVSSSASDNSTYNVTVVGKDSNGIIQSEVLTLNGVTKVTGSRTWATGYPIRISKSAKTNGNITVTTGSTTILVLGVEDRSARFKVIGLYPIPSAAISVYVEYYTRIRQLVNDTDTPDLDEKWIPTLVQGTLAKVFQYQRKTPEFIVANNNLYTSMVKGMVKADIQNIDDLPVLYRHNNYQSGVVELSNDEQGLIW